jgi:hypothetical protein
MVSCCLCFSTAMNAYDALRLNAMCCSLCCRMHLPLCKGDSDASSWYAAHPAQTSRRTLFVLPLLTGTGGLRGA